MDFFTQFDLFSHPRKGLATHECDKPLGHRPFALTSEPGVKHFGYNKSQNAITKKFQALVAAAQHILALGRTAMGKRYPQKIRVRKTVINLGDHRQAVAHQLTP